MRSHTLSQARTLQYAWQQTAKHHFLGGCTNHTCHATHQKSPFCGWIHTTHQKSPFSGWIHTTHQNSHHFLGGYIPHIKIVAITSWVDARVIEPGREMVEGFKEEKSFCFVVKFWLIFGYPHFYVASACTEFFCVAGHFAERRKCLYLCVIHQNLIIYSVVSVSVCQPPKSDNLQCGICICVSSVKIWWFTGWLAVISAWGVVYRAKRMGQSTEPWSTPYISMPSLQRKHNQMCAHWRGRLCQSSQQPLGLSHRDPQPQVTKYTYLRCCWLYWVFWKRLNIHT